MRGEEGRQVSPCCPKSATAFLFISPLLPIHAQEVEMREERDTKA